MTRTSKITISLLLTVAVWAATTFLMPKTVATATTPGFYAVTHVVDGDTIDVAMGNTTERVRLIGVDTPETKKPDSPVQCFGPQASDFTKKYLNGQSVRLVADPQDDNRDRYGRLLRYVYLQDGTLWDQKLIAEGYGFAYLGFPFSKKVDFAAAEKTARSAKRGLWAACTPANTGGRWQSNDL